MSGLALPFSSRGPVFCHAILLRKVPYPPVLPHARAPHVFPTFLSSCTSHIIFLDPFFLPHICLTLLLHIPTPHATCFPVPIPDVLNPSPKPFDTLLLLQLVPTHVELKLLERMSNRSHLIFLVKLRSHLILLELKLLFLSANFGFRLVLPYPTVIALLRDFLPIIVMHLLLPQDLHDTRNFLPPG
jgi:hypothetical protein